MCASAGTRRIRFMSRIGGHRGLKRTRAGRRHPAAFDIADIDLQAPVTGSTVVLPATFSWTLRNIANENYELWLFDPDTNDAWYWYNLGDTGS